MCQQNKWPSTQTKDIGFDINFDTSCADNEIETCLKSSFGLKL